MRARSAQIEKSVAVARIRWCGWEVKAFYNLIQRGEFNVG